MTDTHGPFAPPPDTAPVRLPPPEAFPDEYTSTAMTDTHGPLAPPPDTAPVRLPPPEAFPDEYTSTDTLLQYCPGSDPAESGPDSRTIGVVIARRCCGWRNPPTPREVYDAMRADKPTPRQLDAMTVVLNDCTFDEVVLAHLEGAFTWRQLARAVHRRGGVTPERKRSFARFARATPWRA